MKYLVTAQAFNEGAGFWEKLSAPPRSIVINEDPYTWYTTNRWMDLPEFVGWNRLVILNVVPEKS